MLVALYLTHTFDIDVFKTIKTNSTTLKYIYIESANITEGCNVAFDTIDCYNFLRTVSTIGMESMVTRIFMATRLRNVVFQWNVYLWLNTTLQIIFETALGISCWQLNGLLLYFVNSSVRTSISSMHFSSTGDFPTRRTQPRGKDVPCRAPTTKWKTNGNIDPWNLKHGQETDHRTIDLRGWRERGENEVEVRKTCETWRTRTGHRRPPSWKTRVRPIRMNVIVWMVQTT